MCFRLSPFLAATVLTLGVSTSAHAADKLKTVASFSILADMVENVGGDRVEVTALVGPDSDSHEFNPTPADAKKLAHADVFFVNGLGFEGWMERLESSSGFKGATVVATTGVKARKMGENDDDLEEHADAHHHDQGDMDPHAWQDLANGEIYIANIRDGLVAADPNGKAVYEANAEKYIAALKKEDVAVKTAFASLPQSHRRIITSHDAFGYFGDAYGLEILAPEGISTASESSAKDVAKIIRQIRDAKIPAVFLESITNAKMLEQIAKESGANIGGTLYSDALSAKGGPAPTYIGMFKHNVGTLTSALGS